MRTLLEERKAFEKLFEVELFNRYYHEFRPQLGDVKVFHDTDLDRGILAQTSVKKGEIYLRNPICHVEDACLVAHELGHLVLQVLGFPACEGGRSADALNTALQDPLVDSSLSKYGFDPMPHRGRRIQESIEHFRTDPQAPMDWDRAGRAKWIANYLALILDRHVLGDVPDGGSFSKLFTSRYPEIAKQAERVSEEVISIGFDTPEKMFKALGKAREMLDAGRDIQPPAIFRRP